MATEVRLNQAALASLKVAAGERVLRIKGNRVLSGAQRRVKVDEGRLRASLTVVFLRDRGDAVARIGTNLDYGLYHHEGTGIYGKGSPIRPKSGQFLRWPAKSGGGGNRRYSGGSTATYIFAREVKGSPGNPYLRDSLKDA